MFDGLSTGFPVFSGRNLVRWPGILPAAILAALAVSPAYAAADAPTQSGVQDIRLAQATADTPKPVEKPAEAAAGTPLPAAKPAEDKPAASEPPGKPATAEPATETAETPAEPTQEPAVESAEKPTEPAPEPVVESAEKPAEPAPEPVAEAAEAPAEPTTVTAQTPAEAAQEPAAAAAEAPAEPVPATDATEAPAKKPAEEIASQTASEPAPAEGLPGYPPILRSQADMPEPVRRTWTALRDTARRGDIEALQPLIEAQPSPPTFAFDEIDQPILYLKSLSGDAEGREILAILLEVLESGFVLADPDTPEAMYLWPYFARHPLEKLTPVQMVEMFTLLTAGDYQDMLSYGAYIFFRVGISPDGTWHFFVAGD